MLFSNQQLDNFSKRNNIDSENEFIIKYDHIPFFGIWIKLYKDYDDITGLTSDIECEKEYEMDYEGDTDEWLQNLPITEQQRQSVRKLLQGYNQRAVVDVDGTILESDGRNEPTELVVQTSEQSKKYVQQPYINHE